MAKIMGIDTNILILVQYIYELSSFCTSILAADPSGTVIHVRNLDFAFADLMRNLTYEGWFYRNETLLFKLNVYILFKKIDTVFKNQSKLTIG